MPTGMLKLQVTAADSGFPIENAKVYIKNSGSDEALYTLYTDISGITQTVELFAPDKQLSLNPDNKEQPFSLYDVEVEYQKYYTVEINGVSVFQDLTSIQNINLPPLPITMSRQGGKMTYDIPPLNVNQCSQSGPAPEEGAPSPIILDNIVIPEYITVHLGRPTEDAENVTVPYVDYIKNVCCSEIYATWPEDAIIANVYCQMSLVLNRVFTEWYRGRGYPFDITNSTSFDQYFVPNRNIFENISQIVDSIFNIHIRKFNFVEPFYAEYCNGTTATCPGLKQWGTVTLAEDGLSPLEILRYYYGSGVNLYTADFIEGIPSSYPGSPLSVGSTGSDVVVIQQQLTRIIQNYPGIPAIGAIDGVFGSATEASVKSFQSVFDLVADGIVGKSTWYKISYIFTSVKKLAELGSEGIVEPAVPATPPSEYLRLGSYGENVILAQFMLNLGHKYYSEMSPLEVDGVFGNFTKQAVINFQKFTELEADGVIGPNTWEYLYYVYYGVMNTTTPSSLPYPGIVLQKGSTGTNVNTMQRYLNVISTRFSAIPSLTIDSKYGIATEVAVRAFQLSFNLTVDGKIGPSTWNRIVIAYDSLTVNTFNFNR